MAHAPLDRRRDLILAAAQDYDWPALRPFVESLRATGYDGEARFFVSGLSPTTIELLRESGVEISKPSRARVRIGRHTFEPYNPRTTRVRWHLQPYVGRATRLLAAASRDRRAAAVRLGGFVSNVDVARYFWYRRYLAPRVHRYRYVMLTDVRDVVFLASPFSFDIAEDVCVFLENGKLRLRDQTNNRGWLIGAYGQAGYEEIADRPISCSGITIGDARAVLEYLERMVDELARLPRQFRGMDQGVHNYLLHNGRIPRARVVSNEAGPVLTIGTMPEGEAAAALRARGRELTIVHQYDRHPPLVPELASLAGVSLDR